MIELQNLSKIYGTGESQVKAINNINLKVEKGDFITVYGPSGSGKSTLLTIMAGLQSPTSGNIIVDGINLYQELKSDGLSRYRSQYLGFIFQAFNLIPYMTLEENVMLPLAHLNFSKKEKRDKTLKAMARVGLRNRAKHLPSELSGGQQQRAAIARALVNEPEIIFADEPTGNLDSNTRDDILGLFKEMNSWGHTVLMVTHDNSTIETASRKVELLDGRIFKRI